MSFPHQNHKIVLSGFEPFGGLLQNPSQRVAEQLDGEIINQYQVIGLVLPVVRWRCWELLHDALLSHNPAFVVALGVSGRAQISLERTAYNFDRFLIPDNDGTLAEDRIVESAPPQLPTGLPLNALHRTLTENGYESQLSVDPGRYLCNHLFFQLQYWSLAKAVTTGFVHLPKWPSQVEQPSRGHIPHCKQVDAVRTLLAHLIQSNASTS